MKEQDNKTDNCCGECINFHSEDACGIGVCDYIDGCVMCWGDACSHYKPLKPQPQQATRGELEDVICRTMFFVRTHRDACQWTNDAVIREVLGDEKV